MATNIEMSILQSNGTYESLYPKINLINNEGTFLPISNTSGSISITDRTTGNLPLSRTSGSLDISTQTSGNLSYTRISGLPDMSLNIKIFKTSYTGNGTDRNQISGVNIKPVILVISFGTTGISTTYPVSYGAIANGELHAVATMSLITFFDQSEYNACYYFAYNKNNSTYNSGVINFQWKSSTGILSWIGSDYNVTTNLTLAYQNISGMTYNCWVLGY